MTPDELDEITALKNQVFSLLIALIVISGTLTVYLYRQTSIAGKELQQAEQIEANLNQTEVHLQTFITQLVAYGQKHPDFAKQVLTKYGIAPIPGIPANATVNSVPGK